MIDTSGPMFGCVSRTLLAEVLAVEEERERRDRDDAGREPVEAVDQVDRLADPEHPQHGDQRDPLVRQARARP
jgi:hypothetical protein